MRNQNLRVMKKIMILAITAILAANVSAQEMKALKGECKQDKKECKFSPEERVEMDIKYLTEELYLDEKQAANFAKTYRSFIKEKAKLNEKYKELFSQDLNERQVKAVLHYRGPKPKGDFKHGEGPKQKGELQRPDGKKHDQKAKKADKKK